MKLYNKLSIHTFCGLVLVHSAYFPYFHHISYIFNIYIFPILKPPFFIGFPGDVHRICLWRAEAKVGIALMQHEATEVATDAELLDPGIFSRRRSQRSEGKKGRHGPMVMEIVTTYIRLYKQFQDKC